VADDQALRLPRDHLLDRLSQRGAATQETELHVNRRLSVGIENAADVEQPPEPPRAAPLVKILDEIGQDEGSGRPMEKPDLGEPGAVHQDMADLQRPDARRDVGKHMLQQHASLGGIGQPGRPKGLGAGKQGLPFREPPIVQAVRGDQEADLPQPAQVADEVFCGLDRRLGQYYVDGVGYATVKAILSGQATAFWLLGLLFLCKVLATSLSLGWRVRGAA
jgi:hypothetical protein